MKKTIAVLLVVLASMPTAGWAVYVCADDRGKTSVQDRPCPEKKASTTNLPLGARELSDRNSIETVNRFYKAMSERDPTAASRFLADTFTSEVRRRNQPTVNDDKASLTEGLHQVLSAAKSYNAKTACRVANRSPAAYSLSCHVDEHGIVMNQSHRIVSNQAVTVVLDGGFVKIGRIISEELE